MTKRKIGFTKPPTFFYQRDLGLSAFLYLLKERFSGQAVHQIPITTVPFVVIFVALHLQQRKRARRTLRDPYFLGWRS